VSLSQKPQQKEDYQLEQLDGELLLFHPGQITIIYCNPTASLVWQLCDGQRTGQDIADVLTAAFPEAAASIPAEIESTLQQFAQHGAIAFE